MTPAIALFYALTIGWQPQYCIQAGGNPQFHDDTAIVKIELEARALGFIYLGGSVQTDMEYKGLFTATGMSPYQAFYTIDAGMYFKVDDVNFRLGMMHECDHPIEIMKNGVKAGNVFGGKSIVYLKVGNL